VTFSLILVPFPAAVSGLPDPRKDHAVCIARFAHDILAKMGVLTKELEVQLGPDTGTKRIEAQNTTYIMPS
jgi:hypothetical protein